jgi:hypothetical protein
MQQCPTGEVAAHFAEVYGAKVPNDTISRITDKVVDEMSSWQARPLDRGQSLAPALHDLGGPCGVEMRKVPVW